MVKILHVVGRFHRNIPRYSIIESRVVWFDILNRSYGYSRLDAHKEIPWVEIWILVKRFDIFHQWEAITHTHANFIVPYFAIADIGALNTERIVSIAMCVVGDIYKCTIVLVMAPSQTHSRIKGGSFYAIRSHSNTQYRRQVQCVEEISKRIFIFVSLHTNAIVLCK